MISVHWIPTHRGPEDKERFAHWKPPFVKIVCVDEKPPYTDDVPGSSTIIIRNHPMSELYGTRGLAGISAVDEEDITAKYEAYFAAFFREAPGTSYREGFSPTPSAAPTWPGRTGADAALASPEQVGTEHAAACQRMAQYCEGKGVARSRLLFEGLNEPQLWANEPPDLTARYYKSFLNGLHGYSLHGVVGNFGVGWPGNGGVNDAPPGWDFFKPVIDVMTAGDYLGLHEYWALQGPQQNWKWWGGRFLQCPYKVPILITECGIDTGVTGNWYGGWYDLPGTMDQKAARYVDEIYWYAKQCSADGRVQGIFPFTYDIGGKEWEKFDIRNQVWIETFFRKLDAEGMPQPGTVTPTPTPTPTPEPTPTPAEYNIIPTPITSEPNAAVSYVDGRCYLVDSNGEYVKPMGGETKVIHVRWRGNTEDAVEPVIVGPHPGYPDWAPDFFSIPLEPKVGMWEIAAEDKFRAIWSPWVAFDTTGTQVHINFEWTPVSPQPQPQPSVPVQAIRNAAWNQLGIPYNPDAAFSKFARTQKLGNPVTTEFDISGYRAQGFAGAIVYAKIGDWANIQQLAW